MFPKSILISALLFTTLATAGVREFPPIHDSLVVIGEIGSCPTTIAELLGFHPLWDPTEIVKMDDQTTFKRDVRVHDKTLQPIEMTLYLQKEPAPEITPANHSEAGELHESNAWESIHHTDQIIAVLRLNKRPADGAIRVLSKLRQREIALASENDDFVLLVGTPHSVSVPTSMIPILHVHPGDRDSSVCPSREDYIGVLRSGQPEHYLLFADLKRNYRIRFWAEPTSLP